MNILFLQFPLQPAWGGAEEQTLLLAQELRQDANEIFLLSSNRPLVTKFQVNNLPARRWWIGWEPTSITALLLFPITLIVAAVSFLFWFLKLQKIDVLICLSLADKLIATPTAWLLGKKVIWVEHTRIGRWLYQNPLRPWYLFLSKKVTIVVPSYFSRNQLLQLGIRIEQIKVIYHGISARVSPLSHLGEGWGEVTNTADSKTSVTSPGLRPPSPKSERKNSAKVLLSSSSNTKYSFTLGYLGRLATEKGVEVLIKALTKLPNDFNLIIAGGGPAEASLKGLSGDLGLTDRITFMGSTEDKETFFQSIDALIVPSIQAESFGLVALEAMAAGVPVIASRIGAIPEIIEGQKTGLLFEPGSDQQLAEKILWVRKNPAVVEKIIQQAHARVTSLFSEERMMREYLKLIR